MDLPYLELTELADLLRSRKVASVEITRAQLDGCPRVVRRLEHGGRAYVDGNGRPTRGSTGSSSPLAR